MDILEKIFGSAAKVKMMRLFLFNPASAFDLEDIMEKSRVDIHEAKKNIQLMQKMGLIKRRPFYREKEKNSKGKKTVSRTRVSGYTLDSAFPYLTSLADFLIHINPMKHKDILNKINRVGKIKLIIISGVFIQESESRVDLLVVGDHIRKASLDTVIKNIESEIGKELRYASFETEDFNYRVSMCDKLVRDILDYPHERVVDKLSSPSQ
jgi:hypothetical protein